MRHLREQGLGTVEATRDAEVIWDREVNEVANALAARRIYESIFGADASETTDAAKPRS